VARLNPDNVRRARDLIALYPEPRSALIPTLHVLQEQDGYLTEDGMAHVAELFDLTSAEVRGTATFYDMFHLEPVGKYLIAVCTNIACMLQGAYRLLEHAEGRLGVAPGGTTDDGMFTLEDAECLALCGNAPCVTVNWRFFGDVDPERFDQLTDDLRAGRLDEEVPPHGTLSRVARTVGLTASGESAPSPNGATGSPDQAPAKPRRVRGLLSRAKKGPEAESEEPPTPPARRRARPAPASADDPTPPTPPSRRRPPKAGPEQ
jgi:NADH-quinone oxidoreductase E subunit